MTYMNELNCDRKLSFASKLGYSLGGTGDAIAYDFIGGFLLFFLTDLVGISPAFAGTITFIAILWDAVTDPIIGMLSDKSKSKYGKKRPFLLGSAIPLALIMIFLFSDPGLTGKAQMAYYLIFALLFWTAYTTFNIPFFALGGCLTTNADERTKIRSIAQVLNFVGVFCASALPTFIIGHLTEDYGMGELEAWAVAVKIIAVIAAVAILISWRTTRGLELVIEETADTSHDNLWREIKEVMSIKPYRNVIASNFLFYACYCITTSSVLYYVEYILGMGEKQASAVYTGVTAGGIIVAIALGPLAVIFDKRTAYILCAFISGAIMLGATFVPIVTLTAAIIYAILINIGSAGHWTLSYTLLYDISEIDEFENGRRREGFLMAYFSFCGKLGSAIASFLTGMLLEFSGYNAALGMAQPDSALTTIKHLFTLWPALFGIACGVVILLSPVTRERYNKLLVSLDLKRQGKEYTTEGFEKLLSNPSSIRH